MAKNYTENLSLTFFTSDDPRLDVFFHVIEGASQERIIELLEKSWEKYPLDTLKLVFNLRDIRHGKGIRAQSLVCLQWLYQNQFENLMLNLPCLKHFGCWKDYLNLLLIALFDQLPYDWKKPAEVFENGAQKFDQIIILSLPKEKRRELEEIKTIVRQVEQKIRDKDGKKWVKEKIDAEEIEQKFGKFDYKSKSEYFVRTRAEKKDKNKEKAKKPKIYYHFKTDKAKLRKLMEFRKEYFQNKYEADPKFKQLYDKIVDIFAEQLYQDYLAYCERKYHELSLASKWMPSRGRHFDKYLFMVLPISQKFFRMIKHQPPNCGDIDARQILNDEKLTVVKFAKIITELRKKILVPEVYMSSNNWDQLDYKCVPSKAMLLYKQAFILHDFERFNQFISTKSLKAGALTPADLVKQLLEKEKLKDFFFDPNVQEVTNEALITFAKSIENQWRSLVDNIKSAGTFLGNNTLAICDTSGSMLWSAEPIKPLYASVGLTLMLLELNDSPWNKCCVTFSESPTFHEIDPSLSFIERLKKVMQVPFGMNTNFNKVFSLLLETAQAKKLTQEQMPRILFTFSDMEFDSAEAEKTNFEVFQDQYAKAGYELPFIVFWNLQGGRNKSTPVQYHQKGVILLSGYSAQTFKFLFGIKDITELTPITMLMQVINDPRYDCVKIVKNEEEEEED